MSPSLQPKLIPWDPQATPRYNLFIDKNLMKEGAGLEASSVFEHCKGFNHSIENREKPNLGKIRYKPRCSEKCFPSAQKD